MQGNLKDAILYASKNPTSPFATQLATMVRTGQFDEQAKQLGLDLTPIRDSKLGVSTTPETTPTNKLPGQDFVLNNVATPLATGLVNTTKALYERGKNIVNDTLNNGVADANKPVGEKTVGAITTGIHGALSGIAGGVGDIFTNMISPFIPQKVKDAYGEATTQAIQDMKTAWDETPTTVEGQKGKELVHNFINSLAQKAKDNPELTTALSDALNVALLGEGSAVAGKVKSTVETGIEKSLPTASNVAKTGIEAVKTGTEAVKTGTENVKGYIGDYLAKRAENKATQEFTNSIDEAKKILNPYDVYTPSERQMALKKGNIETSGKGIFSKEKVTQPTTPTVNTLTEMVNEGKISAKNLPSKNIEILKQEARTTDTNIDSFLSRPELNAPYTNNMVNKVFDRVFSSAKNDLVFVADSTEQKAYQAVVDVAKEEIAKQPKNMAGLREGIKAFNQRMERILGQDIYSGASESVGNARITAAKDVRSNLNNFIADNVENSQKNTTLRAMSSKETAPLIEKAKNFDNVDDFVKSQKSSFAKKRNFTNPSEYSTTVEEDLKDIWNIAHTRVEGGGNSLYRSTLQKEAQLLNSADEIAYRARGGINKSDLKRFIDKHPLVKKGVGYVTAGVVGGEVLRELGL